MRGQGDDVFLAFPQGREAQVNNIEAVKEVATEAAFFHRSRQVGVGGGDDPHIHLDGLGAANPDDLAVLQHPQQGRLHLGADIANLVEKNGAAIRDFKFALAAGDSACERAFFVAEEVTFQKTFRDSSAVELEIGAVGARAVPVDEISHQLLARARLASDEDGGVGVGHLIDHGAQLTDRLAFPDHFIWSLDPAQFFF